MISVLYRRHSEENRMILESLPVSHYVDKVRWCLDKLGQPYEEESDVGILGVMILGRMVPALR